MKEKWQFKFLHHDFSFSFSFGGLADFFWWVEDLFNLAQMIVSGVHKELQGRILGEGAGVRTPSLR